MRFAELNLNNAFLFAAALSDNETCKLILEQILGRELPDVVVHTEHNILYSSDFRSIRLDVYARDAVSVEYNVEMQNKDKKNLAKRSRFHQAQMDVASLKPGEDYAQLKPGYVIFICTYDPYGKGLYRYTFENRCLEEDMSFGDETYKIVLSTKGENPAGVSAELIELLKYVENSTDDYVATLSSASKVHQLHRKVSELKRSREWEERYMMFEELLKEREDEGRAEGRAEGLAEGLAEGRAEGLAEGRVEGENRLILLVQRMKETGESALIPRLFEDREFLQKMYEKYQL